MKFYNKKVLIRTLLRFLWPSNVNIFSSKVKEKPTLKTDSDNRHVLHLLLKTKNKIQTDLLSNLITKCPRQFSVFWENHVRVGKNA